MSLETLVGRYGMIGGAVLLLLMGIGSFISWAIVNNVITPVGRVGLGALGALAFVAAGFALRKRGEKKFATSSSPSRWRSRTPSPGARGRSSTSSTSTSR
jgi:hypothetical protein